MFNFGINPLAIAGGGFDPTKLKKEGA